MQTVYSVQRARLQCAHIVLNSGEDVQCVQIVMIRCQIYSVHLFLHVGLNGGFTMELLSQLARLLNGTPLLQISVMSIDLELVFNWATIASRELVWRCSSIANLCSIRCSRPPR